MTTDSGVFCERGTYENASGVIVWGETEYVVRNADFSLGLADTMARSSIPVVTMGEGDWLNGILEYGIACGCTWHDGTWCAGLWIRGDWHNGTWEFGSWESGFWGGGTWKNGNWRLGDWHNGTWHDGTWQNGHWKDGTWVTGSWYDGVWEGGTWKDGIWFGGTWKSGTWEHGRGIGRGVDRGGRFVGDSPDKW